MTLEKAIRLVEIEYERATKIGYVRNPLAYALYKVWKMVDGEKPQKKEKVLPKTDQKTMDALKKMGGKVHGGYANNG